MVIALVPELVRVIGLGPPAVPTATLPQVSEEGDAVAVPPDEVLPVPEDVPVAVPETEICWGLLVALSVKFRVAVRVPEAVGLKRSRGSRALGGGGQAGSAGGGGDGEIPEVQFLRVSLR